MRRTKEMQWRRILLAGVMAVGTVLLLVLFAGRFSMISHAESAAKVTATTANIRTEPSSTSATIGSTERDKVISIKSQVTGADGYTWYEVYVNADTLGYIRSDLVQITDGTTPPTGTGAASSTPQPPAATQPPAAQIPDEPLVDVTAVNPASAEVTGGDSVRVRQNASTTSRILNTVKSGMALTITGTATGTDGKTWYQVTFINNGAEVTGFIRCDFTTVAPEALTPYVEEPPVTDDPPAEEPPVEEPSAATDPYDVIMQNGEWGLVDYEGAHGDPQRFYEIQQLFDGVKRNGDLLVEANKTVKTQKIIIILLVILLVGTAAAITLLIFKVKDMSDAQYFNEVENETLKRRSTRPQGSGQRAAQNAGGRPAGASQGQRPQGSRPAGASQGQRPQGSRPAGGAQGQRPQGGRPAGAAQGQRPQGGRPAGAAQGQQQGAPQGQQRPAAQPARPSGAAQNAGGRPAGAPQGQQRPAAQGQRPQGNRPAQGQQSPGWQSKNFMADEDEFEFEFLNYDGDDQK